jgi:hypothetical protein
VNASAPLAPCGCVAGIVRPVSVQYSSRASHDMQHFIGHRTCTIRLNARINLA